LNLKSAKIMKSGKIILGAVALVVTAGSAIAMKSRTDGHQLYTKTSVANGGPCHLVNCFTKVNGTGASTCNTATKYATNINCTKTFTGLKTSAI
jgi:hypothetical protein